MALGLTSNKNSQVFLNYCCCTPNSTAGANCCSNVLLPDKLTVTLYNYENNGWPCDGSTSPINDVNFPRYNVGSFHILNKTFEIDRIDTPPNDGFFSFYSSSYNRPNNYAYIKNDIPIQANVFLKNFYQFEDEFSFYTFNKIYDDTPENDFYLDFGIFCGFLPSGIVNSQYVFLLKTVPGVPILNGQINFYNFNRAFYAGFISPYENCFSPINLICEPYFGMAKMKPGNPFTTDNQEFWDSFTGWNTNAGYLGAWMSTAVIKSTNETFIGNLYYRPAGSMKVIITE